MVKEGNAENDIEKLKASIQKMREEMEQLKKKTEELSEQTHGKEETGKTSELSNLIGAASELLEEGFDIFGISGMGQVTTKRKGGLMGLIGDLAQLAEKSESFRKEFDLGGKKGVVDFRIRTGPLKRRTVERRGSFIKRPLSRGVETHRESTTPTTKPVEEKEPIVDVFEGEGNITIMVELPGAAEKDVHWDVEGNTLTIRAGTSEVKYHKEIVLPAQVEKNGAESTFRNGILEVKLRKKQKGSIE